jgi:hypothetical protein
MNGAATHPNFNSERGNPSSNGSKVWLGTFFLFLS